MLTVIMLNVIVLSVIMLVVVAPLKQGEGKTTSLLSASFRW